MFRILPAKYYKHAVNHNIQDRNHHLQYCLVKQPINNPDLYLADCWVGPLKRWVARWRQAVTGNCRYLH